MRVFAVYWVFSLVWLGAEYLGAVAFSVYSLGPGSVPNSQFSFPFIGYLFVDVPLVLPVAVLGGVYVLTIVGVLFVQVWYELGAKRELTTGVIVASATLILVVMAGNITLERAVELPSIAVIDTTFDTNFLGTDQGMIRKEALILNAVETALESNAEFIVLPEDSRFTSRLQTPNTRSTLSMHITAVLQSP